MQVGDRYLEGKTRKLRVARASTLIVAIAVHVGAVAVLVGWGVYASANELPAPERKPPFLVDRNLKGGGGPKLERWLRKAPSRVTSVKRELVQPKEKVQAPVAEVPKAAADSSQPGKGDGHGDGNGHGDGTDPNGSDTGTCIGASCGEKSPAPRIIEPQIAMSQRIAGAEPTYSPGAKAAHVTGTILAKVCVSAEGGVSSALILKSLPMLDDQILNTVRSWRYKPFLVDGKAMPFCHVASFVFRLEEGR